MDNVTPEGKLLELIKKAQGKMKLKNDLKVFTKVNIALCVLIVVVLAVFLADVFTFDYKMPEVDVNLPQENEAQAYIAESVDLDKERYEMPEIVAEKETSVLKEDLAKELNLLGIIEGDDAQAIIEDKKSQETFFVYKGDTFEGFKVHNIKGSRVILDYKGEKIEIKM